MYGTDALDGPGVWYCLCGRRCRGLAPWAYSESYPSFPLAALTVLVEGCTMGDKPAWISVYEAFPLKGLHEDFVYPPFVADPAWAERARSVILKTDAQKAEYDRQKEEIAQLQVILAQQQEELEAEERRAEERRATVQSIERILHDLQEDLSP